jgi:hypothetical protein
VRNTSASSAPPREPSLLLLRILHADIVQHRFTAPCYIAGVRMFLTSIAALSLATGAVAQGSPAHIQTPDEALAQDAAAYAARYGVAPDDAVRRLRAETETVAATQAIAAEFADRLAGIAIDHVPGFRIVVLLAGGPPVPGRILPAGGMTVPVDFRTTTSATHAQLLAALSQYQAAIRASLRRPPGIGIDQRTGELVVLVAGVDADRDGVATLQARFAALTGVPVRVRAVDRPAFDMQETGSDMAAVEGGARVVGTSPVDGRRYACTTGFSVTDGVRQGVVTAAHCPDTLSYIDPAGGPAVALPMVGQWGWGHQDVQVNVTAGAASPYFYADTAKRFARPVTGQRPRAAARAGDTVCHRGERTGYSCAPVELTDFAPAGDLCGGACLPTWITAAGPTCKSGDSGAPVFAGTTALGVLKGGSYRSDGSCAFWFYMSTDYLPDGWSLIRADGGAGPMVAPPPLPPPPASPA